MEEDCEWVELDDESNMDWSKVKLPKRSIKAMLKETEKLQVQRAIDFSEKSTKCDTKAEDLEGMYFLHDNIELCKKFADLEPMEGCN